MAWKTARLEEVTQVLGGGTPSRNEESYFGGGIAWATPTDITALNSLYISKTKETITDAGLQNSSTKLMPPGAVLLTSRATIGFTAVAVVPICTNQGFVNFICGPELVPEYLAYWLQTQKAKMIQHAGGTTFKEIGRGALKKFEIPIPALPEQRRIVDLLSRAEGIVRLRREAEKKAAELIPALFLDMFGDPATNPKGWPVEPLSNVCSINPRLPKGQKPAPETPVSFVPMAAVDEHYGAITKKEIRSYEAVSKGYTAFQNDDVLFAKITPCMENGKAAIADDLENGLGFGSTEFHVLRPTGKAHKAWLYGLVRLELFRQEAKRSFTGTAGQQRVPTEYLKSLDVPIPPMHIQEKFDDAIVSIRSIQSQQSTATAKAQATFDALLARVFSQGSSSPVNARPCAEET